MSQIVSIAYKVT